MQKPMEQRLALSEHTFIPCICYGVPNTFFSQHCTKAMKIELCPNWVGEVGVLTPKVP